MTASRERPAVGADRVLITGGAGFIGTNLGERLLSHGATIRVLDNLSRPGVEENLDWLRHRHGAKVEHVDADVRDAKSVAEAVNGTSFVYHLAAQVAVTTSLAQPLEDHAVNVAGTLNLLEAVRRAEPRPGLMFASTNKVYGALPDIRMRISAERCVPVDDEVRLRGVNEERPLDFISPYGCSKGAADQYVLDYCRSFGIAAVVLRMSCIYGPHQRANSDQGWVAHFLRTALADDHLTIFGDGRQVRDVLHVDDFVDALLAVRQHLDRVAGQAFNMGGGVTNTLSLLELIRIAERLAGHSLDVSFDEPRLGDQAWFAADHRKFSAVTGWQPRVSAQEGIEQLWDWLVQAQRHAGTEALQQAETVA